MSEGDIETQTVNVEDLVTGIIDMFEVNQVPHANAVAALMATLVEINDGECSQIEFNNESYVFGKDTTKGEEDDAE